MLHRYRMLFAALLAFALATPAIATADKGTESLEKYFNPLGGAISILADVPEVEPNQQIWNAQAFECGNTLRPATIGVAADTDYVKFTVPAGTIITVGTDADGTVGQVGDTRIRLMTYDGFSVTVLASDDDSGPGLYSLLTYTTTSAGTYYVGFAAFSATKTGIYKGFVTCTIPQPPPANDNCAGAQSIECGNINVSGTTAFATNDFTPLATGTGGCTGFTALGRDVVYMINASGGDVLDVNYTSAADGSVYLITNCGSPATTCVAGADATLSGVAEHLNYSFPSSGVYFLVLDNFGTNAGGAFTLTGTMTCQVVPTNRHSWGSLKTIYR